MRIIIPDNICNDKNFTDWLVSEIKKELILICDERKLKVIGDYIEGSFEVKIDIFDAFFKILNSIKPLKGNRITQIVISNKILYNDIRLTTNSVEKLIDVGNFDVPGTHIFTRVFSEVQNNMRRYLSRYIFENGGI
jgi:hypothetical protein